MGCVDGYDLSFSVGGDGLLCIWRMPGTLLRTVATGSGLLDVIFVPPRHIVVAGWRGMFLLSVLAATSPVRGQSVYDA